MTQDINNELKEKIKQRLSCLEREIKHLQNKVHYLVYPLE